MGSELRTKEDTLKKLEKRRKKEARLEKERQEQEEASKMETVQEESTKMKKKKNEEKENIESTKEVITDIFEKKKKKKRSIEEVKEEEKDITVKEEVTEEKNKKKRKKDNDKKIKDEEPEDEIKDLPKGAVALDKFKQISETSRNMLKGRGFNCLFEIQAKSFTPIFEGKDTVGKAKTGCGKTLAFVLPVVEKIIQEKLSTHKPRRTPLCIVVAPTRELARQIATEFETVCSGHDLKSGCFYGGTLFGPQCQAIRDGLDIMVCTPGRILDHIRRETVDLKNVKFAILDEADEMLSMGFQDDMEEILAALTGERVQKLFFSATMPQWLDGMINKQMDKPVTVDVTTGEENQTNQNICHQCIACMPFSRADTLGDLIKVHAGAIYGKTVIFCDSKKEVNELCQHPKLVQMGAGMLHGDIPQEAREVTLENFRSGKIRCLIATDVASRGLDIPSVDLVVNTRPPTDIDTYVHRSGRTARAGKKGTCITFYGQRESYMIRILRSKLGVPITRVGPPLPADIVRKAGTDAVKMIDNIPAENIEYFLDTAKQLIEDRGAESSLAAALAAMTGYSSRVEGRSLLCGMEGFTTMILNNPHEMWTTGKGWGLLKDRVWDLQSEIKGLALCEDKKKCVFDVPSAKVKQLLTAETWDGVTFEVATELPEVEEKASDANADWAALRERNSFRWNKINEKKAGEKRGKGGGKGVKGKGKGKK